MFQYLEIVASWMIISLKFDSRYRTFVSGDVISDYAKPNSSK